MKKVELKIYRIKEHTDDWYKFRENGFGGSEVSGVLGISKYNDPVKLFYEKVGLVPLKKFDNEAMFHGRMMENYIANLWQYWDGEQEKYIENLKAKKKIRRCRNLNGYVVNPKYEWLFASFDRLINKEGGFRIVDGSALEREGILEIKTITSFTSSKWKYDLPPDYVCQVQQYMTIYETDYAEIVVLKDGRFLDVYPLEYNKELAEQIINTSHDLWYKHILPAKKVKKNLDLAIQAGEPQNILDEIEARIQALEPEPSSSEAYEAFIKEKFNATETIMRGDEGLLELAMRDKVYLKLIQEIEEKRQHNKNLILQTFDKNKVEKIEFEGEKESQGNLVFKMRKNSKFPQFGNYIKESLISERVSVAKSRIKEIL